MDLEQNRRWAMAQIAANISPEELLQQIEERQNFIARVIGFVVPLLTHMKGAHAEGGEQRFWLFRFHGFDLEYNCGEQQKEVKIKEDTSPYEGSSRYFPTVFLEVQWTGDDVARCEVAKFDPNKSWQRNLYGLMDHGWEVFVRDHERTEVDKKLSAERKRAAEVKEEERKAQILAEACRLKIV